MDQNPSTDISEITDVKRKNPGPVENQIPPFADMKYHWAKEYSDAMQLRGVMMGVDKNNFGPNKTLTHAELTNIALTAFGINVDDTIYGNLFNDKNSNATITRAEAIKIILETSGVEIKVPTRVQFTDVPTGSWYEKYAAYAYFNGMVDQFRGGAFGPEESITRAEVARAIVTVWELMQ